MLYTRKGDSGKTAVFGCDQRISKSSAIAEALGTLDEINSFLGVCKVLAHQTKVECGKLKVEEIINAVQQNLFIVQAELAGADKIIIKENSCIGSHSVIMPGVTIGKNSVIGAFSFVNKDIPDDVIAYGVPVKIKKIKPINQA